MPERIRDRPVHECPEFREENERPRQVKYFCCHRRDHSGMQCPKLLTCDYWQICLYTTKNCMEQLAVRRPQELLNNVRIATQETLAVIRGVASDYLLTATSLPWESTAQSNDHTPPIIHNLTQLTFHQCTHRIHTLMPSSNHS